MSDDTVVLFEMLSEDPPTSEFWLACARLRERYLRRKSIALAWRIAERKNADD